MVGPAVAVLRWLWQAYRADLAPVVHGLPYADGRYQARMVDGLPDPDVAAYLAWRPHPNTGEAAPAGRPDRWTSS